VKLAAAILLLVVGAIAWAVYRLLYAPRKGGWYEP
jgi:hypothetical protein